MLESLRLLGAEEKNVKYVWRHGYKPKCGTKHGVANCRSFEALAEFLRKNGPQTQEALEAHARRFHWHHQFSANVPGGIEFVRWHISHDNLISASG